MVVLLTLLTRLMGNLTLQGRFENTYPGVANDIPSHIYTFSWDPNTEFSQYYASGSECQRYFEGFADRHGMAVFAPLGSS